MNHALAITGGLADHSESEIELMRILVDRPWTVGGERSWATELWAERKCPEPIVDEPVSWDHEHVVLRGVTYRKIDNDRSADDPRR